MLFREDLANAFVVDSGKLVDGGRRGVNTLKHGYDCSSRLDVTIIRVGVRKNGLIFAGI